MNKRLENILTERLESIFHNGSCFISWAELQYWYEAQRITANVYKDLEARFQEINDNMKHDRNGGNNKLMKIQTTATGNGLSGMLLFAEKTCEPLNP